jgi:preprotein translocase subunit SecG
MLNSIVLIFHVAASLLIIGLVLLQRGKGAEAGTGFGAGASGTVFGARGSANFLSRATGVLTALFFVTSLTLAYLSTQRPAAEGLLRSAPVEQSAPQPAPAPEALPPPSNELPPAASNELPPAPSEPAPQGSTDEGK